MSTDQENAVTVTGAELFKRANDRLTVETPVCVADTDMVKLYKGLNDINVSIQNLSKASILNKGAAADSALNAARDLLANQIFTIHKLFNDQTRIKAELARIGNIGVIKNG